MEFNIYKNQIQDKSKKVIYAFKISLSKVFVGRANPMLFENIKVKYYEELTPMNELVSFSTPQHNQLILKPYDVSSSKDIIHAINAVFNDINMSYEGNKIRIIFPDLTTETRKKFIKNISHFTENTKVQIRLIRQEINKLIKNDEELTEDEQKIYLKKTQALINKYIQKIDTEFKEKEIELIKL